MSGPRATLVLVHGAWHGSWCWERLLPQLAARGVTARTVDLPSVRRSVDTRGLAGSPGRPPPGEAAKRSGSPSRLSPGQAPPGRKSIGLREDADAVRAVIKSIEGPVVLCGHSYGGMVISLAASRRPDRPADLITRLIYLCAFMPEPRQSLVAIGGNRHAPWIRMLDDEMTLPDLALAGEVFYNDCDEATRRWAIDRLAPQCNAAFIAPVARPAWRDIPSTYIVCAHDGAMPPDLQRSLFAPRAARSLELDTGHSPFLSQPATLADALAGALDD